MALTYEESIKLLEEAEYGIVSTIGGDGYPYGFPMSHVVIDGSIYFHCGLVGHKIVNMDYNNKVSFSVVGRTELMPELLDTNYESVIVFGKVSKVQGVEKEEALIELVEKYAKGFLDEGKASIEEEGHITNVYKISMENITGKIRWGDRR